MKKKVAKKKTKYVVLANFSLHWSVMFKEELDARTESGEFDPRGHKIFVLGKEIKIKK